MEKCTNCQKNPAGTPEPWEKSQVKERPYLAFCKPCRSAHGIVHTSVDDAKQSIATASAMVCLDALLMIKDKPNQSSRRKLLEARLARISKDNNKTLKD